MPRFASSVVAAGTIPANVNALIATTLPKVQPSIVDNFFNATPFFWWMKDKGRADTWDGGESIEIPVMYDGNPNAKAYDQYEVMDATPPQGIGTTVWRMAHYRVPIMYSRNTAVSNRGDSAVVNLIAALKQQAELSLTSAINTDLFTTSRTVNNKLIYSMYQIVDETASASQTLVIGGILRTTYTWWRNQYISCCSASASAGLGLAQSLRMLYAQCENGSDHPDLGLCDRATMWNLEGKLATSIRFVNQRAAEFGFDNMTYKGMTIMSDQAILDDDYNANGDGSLFLLNTKYLKLMLGSDANFKVLAPEYDKWQDAFIGAILVDIQLTCSNCKRQGSLVGGAFGLAT
jgi:hypothetical protein